MLTFETTFQRFILPEVNTHRMLSKSTGSSRAIPTKRLLEMVRTNPAMPVHWGKNEPGMQANAELVGLERERAISRWRAAAFDAAFRAELMANAGVHKQVVNRILEPYLWVRQVISGTKWANFFALRTHEDAQPEFRALAVAMWEAMQASTPQVLQPGQWHLPYITGEDYNEALLAADETLADLVRRERGIMLLLKVSAARCARVSYKTHDGKRPSFNEDAALFDRLMGNQPVHASPTEHQATPDNLALYPRTVGLTWMCPEQHGNLSGWIQHRKLIPGENIKEFTLA